MHYERRKGKEPAAMLEIIRTYEGAIKKMGGSLVSQDDCCNATLNAIKRRAEQAEGEL